MAIVLTLCFAHVIGNRLMILACLSAYMVLAACCCFDDFTLPILLFFLPWSPIMRLSPGSYSFYTFGTVMICLISVVKKRFHLKRYQITAGVILLVLTLLSKLLEGSSLTFDYIAFMMMIILFPTVHEEERKHKYDFYQLVIFLSLGVIIASLCAMYCADHYNIRQFISVASYLTIIRRSGFYGDPNFYVAQILAALGGTLSLTLKDVKKKQILFLGIMAMFLFYCGMLSGSKSFVLVAAAILLIWMIAILSMRKRTGLKIVLLSFLIGVTVFVTTSVIFSGLIEVVTTRFSFSKDIDSFTTGRTELWRSYFEVLLEDPKTFLLGKGITNIKVNAKASHSTIIQIFYQLGLLGSPVLIYWIVCYFRRSSQKGMQRFGLGNLMVVAGAFMPWLAIDAMLFDEFFLFPWYVIVSMKSVEIMGETNICAEHSKHEVSNHNDS